MCITFRPCREPDLPGIYWRDDDEWRPYDRKTSLAILRAAGQSLQSVFLGVITSRVYPNGSTYMLNLATMKQTNSRSGQERPVLFVPSLELRSMYSDIEKVSFFPLCCDLSSICLNLNRVNVAAVVSLCGQNDFCCVCGASCDEASDSLRSQRP